MGYTIHWEMKAGMALAAEEVDAALLHLSVDYDPRVLRLEVYQPGRMVSLAPAREVQVEALTINAARKGIVAGSCKTNRTEPEDGGIKRLLVRLNRLLGNKLHVHCDDGYEYTGKGISIPNGHANQVTLAEATMLNLSNPGGDAV
jgi:hypothetical protein